MVSTHFNTKMARRAQITAISTNHASSGELYFSTDPWSVSRAIPGMIYATGNTYINFPVENPGNDMAFYVIYNGPSTVASTDRYAAISLQKRPATQGGFMDAVQDSTKEGSFERIYSTAAFLATSSQAQAFLFGPVDTMRYGCTYGATSSGDVDTYQTFIRMMVGHSTATTCTHDALSTNAPAGGYYILPIQMGSTR
jgi:hypothetical protein